MKKAWGGSCVLGPVWLIGTIWFEWLFTPEVCSAEWQGSWGGELSQVVFI